MDSLLKLIRQLIRILAIRFSLILLPVGSVCMWDILVLRLLIFYECVIVKHNVILKKIKIVHALKPSSHVGSYTVSSAIIKYWYWKTSPGDGTHYTCCVNESITCCCFSLAILTAASLHLGKLAHAVVLSVGTTSFE